MARGENRTAALVRSLVTPIILDLGYRIWDVEYLKEGPDWILRVTIDQDGGISIDDCEKVHRAIESVIDEADPIEISYMLQVSSPGIERNIRTPEQILACLRERVRVKLFQAGKDGPLAGRRQCCGILEAFDPDADTVTIREDDTPCVIPLDAIAKMTTVFDFD